MPVTISYGPSPNEVALSTLDDGTFCRNGDVLCLKVADGGNTKLIDISAIFGGATTLADVIKTVPTSQPVLPVEVDGDVEGTEILPPPP